jgi:lysophospholipase L1-like esterase
MRALWGSEEMCMVVKLLVGAAACAAAFAAAQGCPPREEGERAAFLGRLEGWDYAPAMQEVARRFTGVEGVVLHLGDSITYASPYTAWARRGRGKTARDEEVLRWSHCGEHNHLDGWYLASQEAEGGRGSYTAASGIRADQFIAGGYAGLPPLAKMIQMYNPQVAIVMLGTNDAWQRRPARDYAADMARIVDALLANGTVVIVSTTPPLAALPGAAEEYNDRLWELAAERRLPVIDFYGEILARRPGDTWNGTLLGKDDPHPTATRAGVTPESEPKPENLRESGYLLRGWLSVQKLAQVKERVIDAVRR